MTSELDRGINPTDQLVEQYERDRHNYTFRRQLYKYASEPLDFYLEGYRKIMQMTKIGPSDIVGDIACYDAEPFVEAIETCGIEAKLVGVDRFASPYFWKVDTQGAYSPKFAFLHNDAANIDLPDNSLKAASVNQFLYLVDDVSKYIAEIKRVVEPNGLVLVSTNGRHNMIYRHNFEDRLVEHIREQTGVEFIHPPKPARKFYGHTAAETLNNLGLRVIDDSLRQLCSVRITRGNRLLDYTQALMHGKDSVYPIPQTRLWKQGIEDFVVPEILAEMNAFEVLEKEAMARGERPHGMIEPHYTDVADRYGFICVNEK